MKEIIEFLSALLSGSQTVYEEEIQKCVEEHFLMPAEKILEKASFNLDLEALALAKAGTVAAATPAPAEPETQRDSEMAAPVAPEGQVPEVPDEVVAPEVPPRPPRTAHFPCLALSEIQADVLNRLPDHAFESSLAFARTRVWPALKHVILEAHGPCYVLLHRRRC